jgi:hypothetical protein
MCSSSHKRTLQEHCLLYSLWWYYLNFKTISIPINYICLISFSLEKLYPQWLLFMEDCSSWGKILMQLLELLFLLFYFSVIFGSSLFGHMHFYLKNTCRTDALESDIGAESVCCHERLICTNTRKLRL